MFTEREVKPVAEEPFATLINWRVFEVTWIAGSTSRHFCGYNTVSGSVRLSTPIVTWDAEARKGVTQSGREYTLTEPCSGVSFEVIIHFKRWASEQGVFNVSDVSEEYEVKAAAEERDRDSVVEVLGLRLIDPTGFVKQNPEVLFPMVTAMIESGEVESYEDENGELLLRSTSGNDGRLVGLAIRADEFGEMETRNIGEDEVEDIISSMRRERKKLH
jgi:hypothetical protein